MNENGIVYGAFLDLKCEDCGEKRTFKVPIKNGELATKQAMQCIATVYMWHANNGHCLCPDCIEGGFHDE